MNITDATTQELIATLRAYTQARSDAEAQVESARSVGQRELSTALAAQRRESDAMTSVFDRAHRLDHEVNRALVRSGAQRPEPPTGGETRSLPEFEKALGDLAKDLRTLTSTLDWLERNEPAPPVAQPSPPPSTPSMPVVSTPEPTQTTQPGRSRYVAIIVMVLLAIAVIVIISVLK